LAKVEPSPLEARKAQEQDMKQTRKNHNTASNAKMALSAVKKDRVFWLIYGSQAV
jgi:hypothetical protein